VANGTTLDFQGTSVADLPVEAIPRRGGRLGCWLLGFQRRCCMEALPHLLLF